MKPLPYSIALLLSVIFLAAFTGCDSTSSPQAHNPIFQPLALREPVITGDYCLNPDITPKPLSGRTPPRFPFELRNANVSGSATIAFIVTTEGYPEQVQAVEATHRGFADAAVQAVQQWRFKPAMKEGKPVNYLIRIPVAFNLDNSATK